MNAINTAIRPVGLSAVPKAVHQSPKMTLMQDAHAIAESNRKLQNGLGTVGGKPQNKLQPCKSPEQRKIARQLAHNRIRISKLLQRKVKQDAVLAVVGIKEINSNEVAEQLGVSCESASASLSGLFKRGLIERRQTATIYSKEVFVYRAKAEGSD